MYPSVTTQLISEHRCLLQLADKITDKLTAMTSAAGGNYGKVLAQIQELRHQFIHTHLPKDQLLIDKLTRDTGQARPLMGTFLNTQSLLFVEHLDRLERDLKAVLMDHVISRDKIVQDATELIASLRSQILFEEEATLPWAMERIAASEWDEIGQHFSRHGGHCGQDHLTH